jgi:hypothetical protein
MDYVITTYRTDASPAEYCPSKNPTGNWYWNLNDGNLPVGQFPSENDAFEDALRSLLYYRDVMGGKVISITHAKSSDPG